MSQSLSLSTELNNTNLYKRNWFTWWRIWLLPRHSQDQCYVLPNRPIW